MGYKTLVLILIISFLSISCSAVNYSNQPNYSVRDYSEFNELGRKHRSTIFLLDGQEVSSSYTYASSDSLFFCSDTDTLGVPLTNIEKVKIKNWREATGNGLVFGLGAFLVAGVAMQDEANSPGLGIVVLGLAAIAGVSCFILEIVYGGESTYIFNENATNEQIENYKKTLKSNSTNFEN